MSSTDNGGFYVTQIAQKGVEDPQQSQESPKQNLKSALIEDAKSLKNLLLAFNSYDNQ